jgi:hypothetical protein
MRAVLVFASTFAGAVLVSALTFVFHWLLFGGALRDGQYVLALLFAALAGAALGGITGLVLSFFWAGQRETASWVGTVGGAVLAGALFWFSWSVLSGTEAPGVPERIGTVLFWAAVPICLSLVLAVLSSRIRPAPA